MGRLFGKMPFDIQACGPVLSTYRDSGLQVKLSMPGPYFVFSGDGGELSTPEFRFMSQESEVVTYWYGGDNNGTKAYPWYFVETKLILKREAEYMIFAVIIPAVAFVIVAYVGFWVDRDAAPARFVPPVLLLSFPSIVLPVCLLSPLTSFASKQGNFRALSLTALPYWLVSSRVAAAVLPIIITITLQSTVYAYIPKISYGSWITDFLFYCLLFNCVAPVEYALVCYYIQNNDRVHHAFLAYMQSRRPFLEALLMEEETILLERYDADAQVRARAGSEFEAENPLGQEGESSGLKMNRVQTSGLEVKENRNDVQRSSEVDSAKPLGAEEEDDDDDDDDDDDEGESVGVDMNRLSTGGIKPDEVQANDETVEELDGDGNERGSIWYEGGIDPSTAYAAEGANHRRTARISFADVAENDDGNADSRPGGAGSIGNSIIRSAPDDSVKSRGRSKSFRIISKVKGRRASTMDFRDKHADIMRQTLRVMWDEQTKHLHRHFEDEYVGRRGVLHALNEIGFYLNVPEVGEVVRNVRHITFNDIKTEQTRRTISLEEEDYGEMKIDFHEFCCIICIVVMRWEEVRPEPKKFLRRRLAGRDHNDRQTMVQWFANEYDSYLSKPPSLKVDVLCRWIFLACFGIFSFIMIVLLHTDHYEEARSAEYYNSFYSK